ncbi:MAG: site-specific integrase [Candidatus Angelobacter sp.]
MQRSRVRTGSVVQDKRDKVWRFFWWHEGKRHSKALGRFFTKRAAWDAAKPLRDELERYPLAKSTVPTVSTLIEHYRVEKMPTRNNTRRSYEMWLQNHIVPRWGSCALPELQARPAELWLTSLNLSPKSKSHIRGLLHTLWDFAMWRGDVPVQRNTIELVTVKGASKRTRQPRSLMVAEFQRLTPQLHEPFRTIAFTCVCFGLRISEALALKWADVDWLGSRLSVERGIVRQIVDDVKTVNSERKLPIDAGLLEMLKTWKQTTQFSASEDWIFASTVQVGRLPYSYTGVLHVFQKAAKRAGIGIIGTHTMRHTFRSWLDAVGTSVAVQQKAMRHADIRTTMNTYGDVVTDEIVQASGKVARLALNGTETARA